MAETLSRPVGIVRGSERPSWMPKPINDFNDLAKVITLLRAIPKREGGKKEDWENPANMPAIPINGGSCPQELAYAIFDFQVFWRDQGALQVVDGVVDPGKHTLAKMNALVASLGAGVGGMSNVAPEGQLDAMACWAASLAWMTRATPGARPVSQLAVINANAGKFGRSGGISQNDLMTADAAGVLLNRKLIDPPELEPIIRAGLFPLLVGFSSGPMSGHVNVIHGFDSTKGEVDAMEPWFPDPSKDANFELIRAAGAPVYQNKSTGAPFVFTGTHVRRPLSYYTSRPLSGKFIVAIPASLSFP